MKSLEFDETKLNNLSDIARNLFEDESDPRSNNYKRIFVRPTVNWLRVMMWFLIFVVYISIILYIFNLTRTNQLLKIIVITLSLFLYFAFSLKRVIICSIQIYQRYAPESIRGKCRFEPSCSQYMILAIQKYGLLTGIKKGVNRLKRCNINGGGFDSP